MGIGALTTISIIGALGISVIPQQYVGLLGLVPIYLGTKVYVDHKRESTDNGNTSQQELQNGEQTDSKDLVLITAEEHSDKFLCTMGGTSI